MRYKQKCKVVSLNLAHPVYLCMLSPFETGLFYVCFFISLMYRMYCLCLSVCLSVSDCLCCYGFV